MSDISLFAAFFPIEYYVIWTLHVGLASTPLFLWDEQFTQSNHGSLFMIPGQFCSWYMVLLMSLHLDVRSFKNGGSWDSLTSQYL